MKPTSIIFIVLSIVIMIVGLFICSAASSAAEEAGIEIFGSEKNELGDLVFTYDFSDDNIKKISIETLDADVNVHSTDGNSYIELINFHEGSYSFSKNNRMISVANNANISSLLQFGSGNFSFNGLRHYFREMPKNGHPKTVNIYINPENELQFLSFDVSSGDLEISSVSAECDYDISVSGGAADIKGIYTPGKIEFEGSSSQLSLTDVACDVFISEQHNGGIVAQNFAVFTSLSAETDSGDISLSLAKAISEYKASISTVKGTVSVLGSNYEAGYFDTVESKDDINFKISVNTGNISIN